MLLRPTPRPTLFGPLLRSAIGLPLACLFLPSGAHALTRQKLDFVVGVNGDFKAAMAAAAKAGGKRFVVFFPDGEYNIGALTGDGNQMTTFTTANVSFIGQSADKTVVYNKSLSESISTTATLCFKNAHNLYMQDMTVKNNGTHNSGNANRHVAIMEQANNMIYKNVRQISTQDTYYTKGTKTYWEGGEIHGTTDFICGGGDVYFNKVLIKEQKVSAITASQSNSSWGYVFKDCTIDGIGNGYTLGRSWDGARTVFLNTKMIKLPSAAGWGDPMNSVPKVFAEYKSVNSSGGSVDLSQRRKSYTKEGTTVALNPVLSDAEAAKYTISNVLGSWQPDQYTKQIAAPVVTQSGAALKWDDNPNALCWVLFKGGKYLANTTTNSYDASALAKGDMITVRAANEMGGLGPSSTAFTVGSTSALTDRSPAAIHHVLDRAAQVVRISRDDLAPLEASLLRLDGTRLVAGQSANGSLTLSTRGLERGVALLRTTDARGTETTPIYLR